MKWAQWISYVLEEEGFTVVVQVWDFRPGNNFVLEMQNAATRARRTIMVLSPDYLKSQFASPEWAAAFAHDPKGLSQKLVPVQVRPCQPTGLLVSIVQIRIAGLVEAAARKALFDGLSQKRAKPSSRPPFPGKVTAVRRKAFPGPALRDKQRLLTNVRRPASPALIPLLRQAPSDVEKRRFVRQGFKTIKSLFKSNLQAVSRQEARIETDFHLSSAEDFRVELFLDGSSKSICRIWQGGMHSENDICYAEGRLMSGNGCNEVIALSSDQDGLYFAAQMAIGMFASEKSYNTKRLTANDAAQYLWHRFVAPLGRQ